MASISNRYSENNLLAISISFYRRKTTLIKLFKTLEDDKRKISLHEKVSIIINLWEHLSEFITYCCSKRADLICQWINCHTLGIVLQGDWVRKVSEDTKRCLRYNVWRFKKTLETKKNFTHHKLLLLLEIIYIPWEHPTLVQILNRDDPDLDSEEVAFFKAERGELIKARLQKLCENKCEDMAINYAEAVLRFLRRRLTIAAQVMTMNEIHFIRDIYIALLYKYKRIAECIEELKYLDLSESLNFINRIAPNNPKLLRIWRYRDEITELATQVFIATSMINPSIDEELFIELIHGWITLQSKLPDLPTTLPDMVRKIIQPAATATHIYIWCKVLNRHFGEKMKMLTIELYIRALTTDMNELENQKTDGNKENVRVIESRLSNAFLYLADLLKDDLGVRRECVLTAFSLDPTPTCYRMVKELAIECGKLKIDPKGRSGGPTAVDTGQELIMINESLSHQEPNKISETLPEDWICINHPVIDQSSILSNDTSSIVQCHLCGEFVPSSYLPPSSSTSERTLDALISIKGDTVTQSSNYDVLSAPNQVLDGTVLNLPMHLSSDLAVVISSPRIKMFSWVLDWSELNEVCENYMNDVNESRCITPELKYLKIDYNQFKDWPENRDSTHIHNGIERGYEDFVIISDEETESATYTDSEDYTLTYNSSSDCESMSRRKNIKSGRCRKMMLVNSENLSDYESSDIRTESEMYHRGIYDGDTVSQDSPDSLGSDGFQMENSRKLISHKRQKCFNNVSDNISRFSVVRNDNVHNPIKNNTNNIDLNKSFSSTDNKMMLIDSSFSPLRVQSALLPEKRSSDPSVLQSLRMYRPHVNKNRNNNIEKQSYVDERDLNNQYAPMLSEINLNPRVMLNRHEENCEQNLKVLNNVGFKLKSDNDMYNNLKKVFNHHQTKFTYNPSNGNSVMQQRKLDLLVKTVCKDSNILADVPGLNSLDMIIPERVESVVQMVQLAQPTSKPSTTGQSSKVTRPNTMCSSPAVINSTASTSAVPTYNPPTIVSTEQSGVLAPHIAINSVSTPVTAHIQRVGQPVVNHDLLAVSNQFRQSDLESRKESKEDGKNDNKAEIKQEVKEESSGSDHNEFSQVHPHQNFIINDNTIVNTNVSQNSVNSEPPQLMISTHVSTPLTSQHGPSIVTSCSKLVNPALVNLLSNRILMPSKPIHSSKNPTIINILSNKILRPPYSTTVNSQSQFVNTIQSSPQITGCNYFNPNTSNNSSTILSSPVRQQLLSPAASVQGQSLPQNSPTTTQQTSVVHAPPQHLLQILNSTQAKQGGPLLKGVNLMTNVGNQGAPDSKMVQFICKTDGKTFQITPFPPGTPGLRLQPIENTRTQMQPKTSAPSTKLSSEPTPPPSQPQAQPQPQPPPQQQQPQQQHSNVGISTRSVYEENYAKFIQTANKTLPAQQIVTKTVTTTSVRSTSNSMSGLGQNTGLPKFNQAFGKSVYQPNPSIVQTSIGDVSVANDISGLQATATVTSGSVVVSLSLPKTVRTDAHNSDENSGTQSVTSQNSPILTSQNSTVITSQHSPLIGNPNGPLLIKRAPLSSTGSIITSVPMSINKSPLTPLSVQTVHGGVIYTRQIPISAGQQFTGATVNRSPVLKIAQSAADSHITQSVPMVTVAIPAPVVVSKNSVIRNKMGSLISTTLASATATTTLAGTSATFIQNTSQHVGPQISVDQIKQEPSDTENSKDNIHSQISQSLYALQAGVPIKLTVPSAAMFPNAKVVRPMVQIPSKLLSTSNQIRQQLLLTAAPASNTRMTQNVRIPEAILTPSPIESSVSSSTLEQLREFDLVLEQVKERSTVQPSGSNSAGPSTPTHVASISSIPLGHSLIIPQTVQAESSSKAATNELSISAGSTYDQELIFTTTGSPVTQRLNLTYVSQNLSKLTSSTPVVVVTNYQQAPSPALSVTSQSSSSPCVTPAPTTPNTSAGKTPPKGSSKSSKSKSVKTNSTNTSKSSPVPKPPQKPQEDEQTAQRIYDILAEYAEQLRNSPDLNNKPAPRRRSNPPTNPGQSSKRKKSSSSKKSGQGTSTASEMSPGGDHTMGSEDSSCGVTGMSVNDSPSQGISSVEDQSIQGDVSSDIGNIRSLQSDSNDGISVTETRPQAARHLIFTEPGNAQQRNVIISESAMNEALAQVGKLGNTAATVLVPGNYILPMSMVKGGQQITIVQTGGSKLLAAMPTRPGTNTNALVLQSFINQAQKPLLTQQVVKTIKIPTVQTMSGINQQSVISNQATVVQSMSTSPFTHTFSFAEASTKESIFKTQPSNSASSTSVSNTILLNSPSSNINIIQRQTSSSDNSAPQIARYPVLGISHDSNIGSGCSEETIEIKKESSTGCPMDGTATDINSLDDNSRTTNEIEDTITPSTRTFSLSFTPQSAVSVINQSLFQRCTTDSSLSVLGSKGVKRKLSDTCQSDENEGESSTSVITSNEITNILEPVDGAVIKLVSSISSNQHVSKTVSPSLIQEKRSKSVLMSTSGSSIINGPLLSQASDAVYNDTPNSVSSGDSIDSGENPPDQDDSLRNGGKVGNGVSNQTEMFSKESTPWRYIPTVSSNRMEYLTGSSTYNLAEPLKLFRDNSETHSENTRGVLQMIDKGSDMDICARQSFAGQQQNETIRKRYNINSMVSYPYPPKSERLKAPSSSQRMEKEIMHLCMERKQASMERELPLQKSLSEECEDLGVDEPSTSDLFPEADLLFDPNHSPSFDQSSQDVSCTSLHKNYSSSNFRPLDSSSNSRDTDFVKGAPEKNLKHDNTGQERHRTKNISSEIHTISGVQIKTTSSVGASLRSPAILVDRARNNKLQRKNENENDHVDFSFGSSSRNKESSSVQLPYDDRSSSSLLRNGAKVDKFGNNQNSNSRCSNSSFENDTICTTVSGVTIRSPLPLSNIHKKKQNKFSGTYSKSRQQQVGSSELKQNLWESDVDVDRATTSEDDMQFTEDDTSQSVGRNSNISDSNSDVDSSSHDSTSMDSDTDGSSDEKSKVASSASYKHRRSLYNVNKCVPDWPQKKPGDGSNSLLKHLLESKSPDLAPHNSRNENGIEVRNKIPFCYYNKSSMKNDCDDSNLNQNILGFNKDVMFANETSVSQTVLVQHDHELSPDSPISLNENDRQDCPENLSKNSSRRLSLRGHVKKNCPCCNGSNLPGSDYKLKKDKHKFEFEKLNKCLKKHSSKTSKGILPKRS